MRRLKRCSHLLPLTLVLASGLLYADEQPPVSVAWAERQYRAAMSTTDRFARRLLLEHLQTALSPRETLWLRVRGSLYVLTVENDR
jgi:hypothetical protein